jgi:hypothetical protein
VNSNKKRSRVDKVQMSQDKLLAATSTSSDPV